MRIASFLGLGAAALSLQGKRESFGNWEKIATRHQPGLLVRQMAMPWGSMAHASCCSTLGYLLLRKQEWQLGACAAGSPYNLLEVPCAVGAGVHACQDVYLQPARQLKRCSVASKKVFLKQELKFCALRQRKLASRAFLLTKFCTSRFCCLVGLSGY